MKQKSEELIFRHNKYVNTLLAEEMLMREYITELERLIDDYGEFVSLLRLRNPEKEMMAQELRERTALLFGEVSQPEPEDEELTDMAKAFRAARMRNDDT